MTGWLAQDTYYKLKDSCKYCRASAGFEQMALLTPFGLSQGALSTARGIAE